MSFAWQAREKGTSLCVSRFRNRDQSVCGRAKKITIPYSLFLLQAIIREDSKKVRHLVDHVGLMREYLQTAKLRHWHVMVQIGRREQDRQGADRVSENGN